MLYVSIGYSLAVEEIIKKKLKDEEGFNQHKQEMAKGFGIPLNSVRRQILVVFQRENVTYIDIVFSIYVDNESFDVEVFIFPSGSWDDKPTILFPLAEMKNKISVPYNRWTWKLTPEQYVSLESAYFDGMMAGGRLASDFGRDGLPTEMKKAIVELSRVFKKARKPSEQPYFNWIAIDII